MSQSETRDLESVATELRDAGCLALLYDEELIEGGHCLLTVHRKEDNAEEVAELLDQVEKVRVGGNAISLRWEINSWGVDLLGRQPLYIHESVATNARAGPDEQSLDDGIAAVAAILQGGE